jgi:drug/metabolite transporter (DMT)-like permease
MPLFATALGHATGQKARAGEWVGLGFGFAGVVLLSAGDLRHVPALGLLLILAPMGWALGSLLARRAGGRGGLVATATPMLSGGAVTAIAGLLAGEPLHIASDARAVVAWLYLVVFGSLVAFSAYSYLLRTTPPAVATSYAFVNPVLAVLLGVAVGGEALTPTAGIAGALVAAGVALVLRARRVPAKVTPSPAAAPRGYSPR